MPGLENQRAAFDFFCQHFDAQAAFTREELKAATAWSESAVNTYWSKQFSSWVREVAPGAYRVTEAFRPFTDWDQFRRHVTQVRPITVTDYAHTEYESVLIFEFFMPLTNETALRATLDGLFYKDTIVWKLRAYAAQEIEERIAREGGESIDDYLERVCVWVSERFVGYSISHVSGRFRNEGLCTRVEAAEIERRRRYLIDETTAITRFIFPCESPEDAELVRWFFWKLFVDSIIEVVNGEEEIWMVESGMRNRLHIWRVDSTA